MILLIMVLTLVISTALIMLNSLISSKKGTSREKLSAFECGYDPKSPSRLPFSMQFFLIAVIFLIFDVEITLIIPMPMILKVLDMWLWVLLTFLFIIILVGGTIHEWKEGSLDWTK
uniref:NADH-ubiquinone oxidoreductase chain 3 n=1 Tax=Sminthurus viridis TaxID=109609 RepID=B2BS92_SMIVR|nr:NADH dehydrogenase subunit 3 [Sminthurus viridis]ABS82048.1 NADH dehydrogenase subunit 3 [Sminthurus viridis]